MTSKLLQDAIEAAADGAQVEDDSEPVQGAPGEFVRPITPHAALSADLLHLQDLVKAREINRAFLNSRRTRDLPVMRMTREGEVETGQTFGSMAEKNLPDIEFDIAELIARIVPQAKALGVRLPADLANMTREGTITGTGI
jgi:hypothetical protein